MTRVAPLASISIDCPDPDALATFYAQLLGYQEVFALPDRSVICLAGSEPGPALTLMRVESYAAPHVASRTSAPAAAPRPGGGGSRS
ncbi:VOC family protein [Arsenicicoccus sp. oral taxon 190]|uniref:VOC family protein n=1 Tax=Arsenicicoccus sp. oral taxon 190 TaxID=1658671 RepID=UPI00209CB070|nr:VOC family protein [Arsenicicoccus sp. oral taxon 190]